MGYSTSNAAISESEPLLLLSINNEVPGLLILVPHVLRDTLLGLRLDPLEHGGVLEHRRHDHESDLRTSQVDLLDWHRAPVASEHCYVVESYVHGVLG